MISNKLSGKWVLFFWLFLTGLAALAYYLYNKPRFVRYPGFGIEIPVNYSIHGIDVSHYQKRVDWEEVRAMQIKNINIGFCFMKATEGTDRTDDMFKRNWGGAKANYIPRGAYHFFNPAKSGILQAKHFIRQVRLEKGDLPPVLDIEQINGENVTDLQQRLSDWLIEVEKKYGVKPIIYTNVGFYKSYLSGKFDDYPLWVAHYLIKNKPRIKRDWIFWQHNESGNVNGIDAYVDFNVFSGSAEEFEQLRLK
ncbi:MAG: GH25 family lysozyme [Bacteroidota bacterium]